MELTEKTLTLLRIAEVEGWKFERGLDYFDREILILSRPDIKCWGTEDPDCGLPPDFLSMEIPVSRQESLVAIIRKYADNFNINEYVTHNCVSGWRWSWYGDFDLDAMEQDGEWIRKSMKNLADEFRQLKNTPEFLQAPDVLKRLKMVGKALKKSDAYLEYCDDDCWSIYFVAKNLVSDPLYYSDSCGIDDTLCEIEYQLDHFDGAGGTLEKFIEGSIGYVYDYSAVLQSSHEMREALKKLADSFERAIPEADCGWPFEFDI